MNGKSTSSASKRPVVVFQACCALFGPLLLFAQIASGEPNPLSAIDVEKMASQIAASDSFREEVRKIFGNLTGSAQPSALRLIDAMSGPQKMQASGTLIDPIVARHLAGALGSLVQDPDTKSIVQTHGDAGRLDLLLAVCTSTTKPELAEEPTGQKITTAKKRILEKAITDQFLGAKDGRPTHYFAKDGTLIRFEEEDSSRATVHKWQILKDGTVASHIFGFNHFWRIAPDKSVQYVRFGVYQDELPVFDKPVPWEIKAKAKLPKKYSIVNK